MTKAPWTGSYYVNIGDSRNWEDMQDHGFVTAGGGRVYSRQMNRLSPGDRIFVYRKGAGYVGYGVVRSPAVRARDFRTEDGRSVDKLTLRQPGILEWKDDPDMSEYLVGVQWNRTFGKEEAKWQKRLFTNQNIVCKLRHPATLNFLEKTFGVEPATQ
jgi:hypothetical protein